MYGTTDGRDGSWTSALTAEDLSPPVTRYLPSGSHFRPSASVAPVSGPHVRTNGAAEAWDEFNNKIEKNIRKRWGILNLIGLVKGIKK